MQTRKKRNVRIIGERNIYRHLNRAEHRDSICRIGKALSSPVRLEILSLLRNNSRSLQEIASALSLPLSSVSLHVKVLEEAEMVVTETQPGIHGSMRVCTCSLETFHLETFDSGIDSENKTKSMDMPIGNYFACDVQPTCGIADENGLIDTYDSLRSFYSPVRNRAQLIWFQKGYVEYRFPNINNDLLPLADLSFCMELCSEAPGFLENWPSDITASINGVEIATYCSPGDYGARRGKLTPPVWPNGNTQYGILKTFSVKENGCYLDEQLVNRKVTLRDLHIDEKPYISFRLEIKDDAAHIGGINLFGEKYGDYPQGIVMNLTYR